LYNNFNNPHNPSGNSGSEKQTPYFNQGATQPGNTLPQYNSTPNMYQNFRYDPVPIPNNEFPQEPIPQVPIVQATTALNSNPNVIQAASVTYKQVPTQTQIVSQPGSNIPNQPMNFPNQAQASRPTQVYPSAPNSSVAQFRENTMRGPLPIRGSEVISHYQNRKFVYDAVFNALKDHDKAISYSNIWSNMHYLGTRYPLDVEQIVIQYGPFVPSVLKIPQNEGEAGKEKKKNA